jgi:hypothetical protein
VITLREQNEESKNCRASAVDVLAVATRIVVVFAASKSGAALHGATSTLPFPVAQVVSLATACTKNDGQKSTVVVNI